MTSLAITQGPIAVPHETLEHHGTMVPRGLSNQPTWLGETPVSRTAVRLILAYFVTYFAVWRPIHHVHVTA